MSEPSEMLFEGFGPAEDGNHRTGYNVGNLIVSREGLQLIYNHMMTSDCMPKPLRRDSLIPLAFSCDRTKPDVMEVYCGICRKHLGSCAGGEFTPT